MQDVVEDAFFRWRILHIALCDAGIHLRNVGIEADTRFSNPAAEQAEDQCDCRNDFKVDQRFDADAAHCLHVVHGGDTAHHGAEDQGGDHHFDQLDE